jgi:hypothetical protein
MAGFWRRRGGDAQNARATERSTPQDLSRLPLLHPDQLRPPSAKNSEVMQGANTQAGDATPNTAPDECTYELMRLLFEAREALEEELALGSKDFRLLRSLTTADLSVCQELAADLKQRLETHPLFKSLQKLDEANALTLRYRRP